MSVKTTNVSANSVAESFEQSGLNFIAEQTEILNPVTGKVSPTHKMIYRSDNGNQLGIVGKGYGVVQNSMQFAHADILVRDHGLRIIKVNEFDGGAVVNLVAEVKDMRLMVNRGDEVGFRINMWNSFNGTTTVNETFGALRGCCKNGMVMMDKAHRISVRHTKNAEIRYDRAIQVWAGMSGWYETFVRNIQILNAKMVDKRLVEQFLDSLLGKAESTKAENKRNLITSLFEGGKGNYGKTAYDLLNGVTEYVDHFSKKTEEDRIEYSSIGGGYDLKAKAFDLAMNIN